MHFDLFSLHDERVDTDMKGSWIKAKGSNLNLTVKSLLAELCKGCSQNTLAREIQKRIDCSFSTAKRQLTKIKREKQERQNMLG